MIGERVAHYEITAFLGRGSQATVYTARDTVTGVAVALKVLLPQLARDPARVQRFLAEVQAATSLDDPRIVRILDHGRDPDTGCLFIVMERLEGVTLAHRLVTRRPSLDEAFTIVYQLVDGLEAAHDHVNAEGEPAPIVHGDIKPENVFLCGQRDRVKIVDFGLARLTGPGAATTSEEARLGSPPYMAPEQFDSGEVDHRADLYALGCILWELVTGEPPFGRGPLHVLIAAHRHDDPGRPSDRTPVPPALDRIAVRLLAKRPADRFQSCAEIKAELDQYRRTRPEESPRPRHDPLWIRNRTPRGAWELAFFVGWLLFGVSLVLDVGESYGKSLNWAATYIVVVPLIVAFVVRAVRDADSAIDGLVAGDMVVDDRHRAIAADHPLLRTWRDRLAAIPRRAIAVSCVTTVVSIGDWWNRYRSQPPMEGEWWVDSPPMGAIGATAQGVLIGIVLTFLLFIIQWAWTVADIADGKLGLALRPDLAAADRRAGFEVLAPAIKACVQLAALLYVALYASNVQHIAIEYGRLAGSRAWSVAKLFRDQPLFDVGPQHPSSMATVLCCASILLCVTVVVHLLHRAASTAAGRTVTLVPGLSALRLALGSVIALALFVVYQLGVVVVAALVVATGAALRGRR